MPDYSGMDCIEYQCFLDRFDAGWSAYGHQNVREYTRLAPGRYVFRVRARNSATGRVAEADYDFEVLPPWYLTVPAKVAYWLFALAVLCGVMMAVRLRIDVSTRLARVQQAHEFEAEKQIFRNEVRERDSQIVSLRNEQLAYQLKHKAAELADSTMNLVRKNELLLGLDAKIERLGESIARDADALRLRQQVGAIRREIRSNIEHDGTGSALNRTSTWCTRICCTALAPPFRNSRNATSSSAPTSR